MTLLDGIGLIEGWSDRAAMAMLTDLPSDVRDEVIEKLIAREAEIRASVGSVEAIGFVFGAAFGLGYALAERDSR